MEPFGIRLYRGGRPVPAVVLRACPDLFGAWLLCVVLPLPKEKDPDVFPVDRLGLTLCDLPARGHLPGLPSVQCKQLRGVADQLQHDENRLLSLGEANHNALCHGRDWPRSHHGWGRVRPEVCHRSWGLWQHGEAAQDLFLLYDIVNLKYTCDQRKCFDLKHSMQWCCYESITNQARGP